MDSKMSADQQRRILVIGAGMSGLVAIKECLAQGLTPICFEQTAELGGLWNFRETLAEDQATVMRSTVVNTSKEMMAFSDFPCPDDYPNFMHNRLVNSYLYMYADRFDLKRHIRFNTEVAELFQSDDHVTTGNWVATTTDGDSETFAAVMLCTGHHAHPYRPKIQGLDDSFKGLVMHSQQYREPTGFEEKSVLVVGIGNSALDAAVELSRTAKKVYMSTRRGAWTWTRVSKNGLPFDIKYLTRFYSWVKKFLPSFMLNDYFEYIQNLRMDHETYGLKPEHRFFEQHPAVNDQLANCICTGAITLKHDVSRFAGDRAVFVDGTQAEVDAVLLCTGYSFHFPYLASAKPQPLTIQENEVSLYKYVFPPDMPHPTLAVIGLVQPYGSLGPMSEIQSRWVARVFSGVLKLPTSSEMMADIQSHREAMKQLYFQSRRHTVQVDFVGYLDEIAEQIDAKPPIWSLLFKDPVLFYHAVMGPNVPYLYRLCGPDKWDGAREAVINVKKRVLEPIQTRKPPKSTISWFRAAGRDGVLAVFGLKVLVFSLLLALLTLGYARLNIADSPLVFTMWSLFSSVVIFLVLGYFNIHYDLSTLY